MNEHENGIQLERYKYILDRKKTLNENTFKIAALFQSGVALICVAQFHVVDRAMAKTLDSSLAATASMVLLFSVWFVTLFAVTMLVGGMMAWLNYGVEQKTLESGAIEDEPIKTKWRVFTWYELYIGIAFVIVAIGYSYVVLCPAKRLIG